MLVQAALSYTQTATLTDAIQSLLRVKIKCCANEKCQKEFIFQEPRSERKPRNDSIYCSRICARQTAQRAYGKRKRQKAKMNNSNLIEETR